MRLALIFMILTVFTLSAQSQSSLAMVRKSFHEAVIDPDKSKEFYAFISEHKGTEPIIKAYQAVSEALLAQSIWNPIAKYAHVKKFQTQMEDVLSAENENLEIRFLRFAVEFYLPKFLMMSEHLEEDRDFIVANLSSLESLDVDSGFARYIVYFMNETGMVDDDKMIEIKASFAPALLGGAK